MYLAGPIDRLKEATPTARARYSAARVGVMRLLVDAGFAVYAPHLAWSGIDLSQNECEAVEISNAAALDACSCVVALLPLDVATSGTYAEIRRAAENQQPVVVVTTTGFDWSSRPPGVLMVSDIESAVATATAWHDTGVLGAVTSDRPYEPEPPIIPPLADRKVALPFTINEPHTDWALPTRHYSDDAAIDLWVTSGKSIEPGRWADVPAGVKVELPDDTFGLILGRSSAVRKRGILVVTGVIDVGWRGDLFVCCYNVGEHPQTLNVGERIGQLVILPNLTQHYVPTKVDSLSDHPRGERGFGSTGGIQVSGHESGNGVREGTARRG